MNSFTINGKTYEVMVDSFGVKYIDGLTIDKWVDRIKRDDPEVFKVLVHKGLEIAQNEPDRFEDIADRIEMPEEEADAIRHLGSKADLE